MDKNYRKIEFYAGENLERVVKELLKNKEKGVLVYTVFNGTTLYSDTVTTDDAYRTIVGKTKAEFDKDQKEWRERLKRQEEEYKEKIPELTLHWIKEGRKVLTEDNWAYWDKIVPIRLNDLYHGMELRCCLDIIKILNSNDKLDEALDKAKREIENQNHSGMSFGLVCAMVREFCDRGREFVDYVK